MPTTTETLTCVHGRHDWTRPRARGRKPANCPEHPEPLPLTADERAEADRLRREARVADLVARHGVTWPEAEAMLDRLDARLRERYGRGTPGVSPARARARDRAAARVAGLGPWVASSHLPEIAEAIVEPAGRPRVADDDWSEEAVPATTEGALRLPQAALPDDLAPGSAPAFVLEPRRRRDREEADRLAHDRRVNHRTGPVDERTGRRAWEAHPDACSACWLDAR
ncbi:hypothetical protein [Terrabacter sp. BE26]|uniref:hypothetical protein n=1 Tax=Terrabacter sp. BE26 TaxID=2898152 RepID=UPI0035BE2C00